MLNLLKEKIIQSLHISFASYLEPPSYHDLDSSFRSGFSVSRALYLEFLLKNIVTNFKSILFCIHTFCVRGSIDVLDLKNEPGPAFGQKNGSETLPDILHRYSS